MTETEEIRRLIHAFENNYFTTGEFQNLAIVQLARLSAAEQRDALQTLSAHGHEDVRNVALEFRLLQRRKSGFRCSKSALTQLGHQT